ncbi:DNA damage-inducible protein [Acidisoma sp. C75]
MSALAQLLDSFRNAAVTEREKGTYFEELTVCYLLNEPQYRDLYEEVLPYRAWAETQGLSGKDTGIDLVARTRATGEFHAIQCKLYGADHVIPKSGIDSFLAASGNRRFTQRIIIASTAHWNDNAMAMLESQHVPVTVIDLPQLESSVVDWARYQPKAKDTALRPKKQPRDHQQMAIREVTAGFQEADRGRMIMACGTGKTFTSLKIAEQVAGAGKQVLFLVPSLSLLSQTLTEWTQESAIPLHSFAVCSDSDVGKRANEDDEIRVKLHELGYPATTDAARLAFQIGKTHDAAHMTVVFSTYHSIEVISQAQKAHGLPAFDLVICDEAHRTTGISLEGEEADSAFVRVHNADYLHGARRLYMTATPRIYAPAAKAQAEKEQVRTFSMNDPATYGPVFYLLTFSEAVRRNLLVDYKVIVLAVEEAAINRRLQTLLADPDNSLKVDDAARIVGCWKGLAKQGLKEDWERDQEPMKRAVAFCQVIAPEYRGKKHKVSSVKIADMFKAVVDAYQEAENVDKASRLICEAEHVDGAMSATEKEGKLNWLKAETPPDTCRVLSNVRCLSEGVDVPALDAVLFLTPRNSQVDVVQSVGRVMRKAPGKQRGYVILPVVIPAGVEPEKALDDNQTYRIVWQVLQALRSHDDRFDASINRIDLLGPDLAKLEVVAITDKIQRRAQPLARSAAKGAYKLGAAMPKQTAVAEEQAQLEFEIGEIERALYAKIVKKVGNRHHWEEWAEDIGKIARTHIDRINAILENPANTAERASFDAFAAELRSDLNDSVTDGDVVEMLAQHLITKPVFDSLFAGYSFAAQNPISLAMQSVLDLLQEHHLEKEADRLESFYASVRERASGIETAAGRQRIIVELYEKFFQNAFPRTRDRLGIVYTPVEVVDFIIRSVNDALQAEFGETLGSPGVHILDPFTGTGTFITRLLQSGLIKPEELGRKYRHEIHANEIVLLAYYIAAMNIEAAYHDLAGGAYEPFQGICLTDTFRLTENHDLMGQMLAANNARLQKLQKLDIRVIIGNPPYSVGQESGNDNNQNIAYPALDRLIEQSYAKRSAATNKRALYDSYIRAIRWASTRLGDRGVIGFVTNAGYLDANTADGLRQCLAEEFSSIYVFHLRGNARTAGETRRREGHNVFDQGSRAPVAISILVKNPEAAQRGQIFFHDIGDYLTREEKLARITEFGSISGMAEADAWQRITPDQHGDWLRQRDDAFAAFMPMGAKRNNDAVFAQYSRGLETARDAWCFNASNKRLACNISNLIKTYMEDLRNFHEGKGDLNTQDFDKRLDAVLTADPTRISWSRSLRTELSKGKTINFSASKIVRSVYRPFTPSYVYFDRQLNNYVNQMPRLFPGGCGENRVIVTSGTGGRSAFTACMVDAIPSLHMADMDGTQCFPLFLYDDPSEDAPSQGDLLTAAASSAAPKRRDAITDAALAHFRSAYPGEAISKEDIFYYIYGLLHSPEYRERYGDTLRKELPRIPRMKRAEDFRAFVAAGRALGDLHTGFEEAPLYAGVKVSIAAKLEEKALYRVTQMRYGGKGREKDRSVLLYNEHITVTGIPLEAYEYVVNGKPALDWVVERQCVKTDKDSGIVNDANDWAVETMGNPRYPLDLFLRVITVSLETMKIVRALPPLDILEEAG